VAKPRPQAAKKIVHPAVPLTEIQIFQTASHTLVGFPDAAPLKRTASNDLDNARLATIRDLLTASPGAAAALKEYAVAHGHAEAGADKADLAAVLAEMWKSGLVIARGPAFKGVTANSRSLSGEGEKFLVAREAQVGVSNKLHHPSAHSGVTLGPGYDMSARTVTQIVSDLTGIGVDLKTATLVGGASNLIDARADKFCEDHADAINLTSNQEAALFNKVVPPYVEETRKGLAISILPRLFQHEFDALVSFTYNLGHLRGSHLAAGINAGKLANANFHRRGPKADRIHKEFVLFTTGVYL
jgi:hypothetical protein